jgi:peptide chain release factor 1
MFLQKVQQLLSRLKEIEIRLSDPTIFNDQKVYKELTQDHSYLSEIKQTWDKYSSVEDELKTAEELIQIESNFEQQTALRELAITIQERLKVIETSLYNLLVPPDPQDHAFAM